MLSAADTTGSSIVDTLEDCRTTTARGGTTIGCADGWPPVIIRSSNAAPW